ncbi:MAG: ATP-dependent Clp protease proteolytic subunit [Trueperaceae bacterium]
MVNRPRPVTQPTLERSGRQRPEPGKRPVCISFTAPINNQSAAVLMAACADALARNFDEIHLLLSSPGGSVADGIAAYNYIRAIPVPKTVYNIGTVDSIANVVFQAFDYRIASLTSRFMFHGVGFDVRQARFELKDLRERMQNIENDQRMIAGILARHTDLEAKEVDDLFLEAAFIPSSDAQKRGIVDEVADPSLPSGIPIMQLVFNGQ